jgi:ribulose-phosphate 3-epimerase
MVLLMTVNPGFGGQAFIPAMIDKIRRMRRMVEARQLTADIEVDGGVTIANARQITAAGANILVAGSAVYGAPDMAAAIKALRGS